MRSGKQHISNKTIELEIYKTFGQVKNKKEITIVDFLSKLNLEEIFPSSYRSIKFPYHSLLRLLIFQKLKGIKFQTQLVRYLKRHRDEMKLLGFKEIPDQTTISYFINHILILYLVLSLMRDC